MARRWLCVGVVACAALFVSCGGGLGSGGGVESGQADTVAVDSVDNVPLTYDANGYSPTEQRLREIGLVDIAVVDPTIVVEMVYATDNNFVGKVLYDDISHAFMLPEAAQRLAFAQGKLREERPELSIVVYDAARPISVQQKMWDKVKATRKKDFVSNPAKGGGLHNYGAAVDVSIVDSTGVVLDMGSSFDHLGFRSRITNEAELVEQKYITQMQLDNRLLLRGVMTDAGFIPLNSEWWHFNLVSRSYAIKNLKIIE